MSLRSELNDLIAEAQFAMDRHDDFDPSNPDDPDRLSKLSADHDRRVDDLIKFVLVHGSRLLSNTPA